MTQRPNTPSSDHPDLHHLTARVPGDVLVELTALARSQDHSVSSVVRRALIEYLAGRTRRISHS